MDYSIKISQKDKISMLHLVQTVMEENAALWTDIKTLNWAFTQFKNNNLEMQELSSETGIEEPGLSFTLDNSRKIVIDLARSIQNVICDFTNNMEDKALMEKLNLFKPGSTNSDDRELIDLCVSTINSAERLHGISINSLESELALLKTAKRNFEFSINELNAALDRKNESEIRIMELINTNDQILWTNLDLLVSIFDPAKSEFYKEYTEARLIALSEKCKGKMKVEYQELEVISA